MLNTLKKPAYGLRRGRDEANAAIELVSVSKWHGVIDAIDRRYARNESLQTMIEVLITVRSTNSLAQGSIQGKPLNTLLKDISVVIDRGSIVGVMDIGGRSRSALLEIMSNAEAPSRGEIRYFGTMAAFSQIGIISYPHMSCREVLARSARALGVKRDAIDLALRELADFSGLGAMLDTPMRRMPRGVLPDLGISFLCCLDYDVLIADELSKPRSEQVMENWTNYLQKASGRGKTIILNSRDPRKLLKSSTHLLLIKDAGLLDYGPVGVIAKRRRAFIEEACNTPLAQEVALREIDQDDEDDFE